MTMSGLSPTRFAVYNIPDTPCPHGWSSRQEARPEPIRVPAGPDRKGIER
jgi:hypothetical protein